MAGGGGQGKATDGTGSPTGVASTASLRTRCTVTSSSMVTVRTPVAISAGSTLKLPESASTSHSGVWVMVCIDPSTAAPSTGQARTSVPPSWRTIHGHRRKASSGSSFTVQRQPRSGSITGWALEK